MLGRVGAQPVLLLETVGRRTGQRRTTPVQYLADGETFVVVASNAGAARPPAWYLNLRADPRARVQVGERTIDVLAREVTDQEREELWRRLTAANRYLERAARKAGRDLPLIALGPSEPTPATATVMTTTPARAPLQLRLLGSRRARAALLHPCHQAGAALPDGFRMGMTGASRSASGCHSAPSRRSTADPLRGEPVSGPGR